VPESSFSVTMVTTRSQLATSQRSHTIKSSIKRKIRRAPDEYHADSQFQRCTKVSANRPVNLPQPPGLPFQLQPASYGLIQERIHISLYALVVQAILWNQTHGLAARPVLFRILTIYPTPLNLSQANLEELTAMMRPIGLQNTRALRLIALAEAWIRAPPCKERRYRKLHYPSHGCSANVKPGEVLSFGDNRSGWEIAHLPGMGPYALDSFRIFYRDRLRGFDGADGDLPEWKAVVPKDKDLRAYLKWKWAQDGWNWDAATGVRSKISTFEKTL
jgi:methyl-CpG-binding domain protein 4